MGIAYGEAELRSIEGARVVAVGEERQVDESFGCLLGPLNKKSRPRNGVGFCHTTLLACHMINFT